MVYCVLKIFVQINQYLELKEKHKEELLSNLLMNFNKCSSLLNVYTLHILRFKKVFLHIIINLLISMYDFEGFYMLAIKFLFGILLRFLEYMYLALHKTENLFIASCHLKGNFHGEKELSGLC